MNNDRYREDDNLGFYTQGQAEINGRHIWHYLVTTPIFVDVHIVEWEIPAMSLERKVFTDNDAAERFFKKILKDIFNGK